MPLSPTTTPRQRSSCLVQSIVLRQSSSITDLPLSDFQELFDILENPISCGYLFTFCESEYNSESIRCIIAIDEFKDMLKRDFGCWKLGWKEVDRSLKMIHEREGGGGGGGGFGESTGIWPSHKVFETEARNKANEIFAEFICHTAPSQICLATDVYSRTQHRIRHLHLYGPNTFDEALLDPYRTLKRDILPRFKNSLLYEEMLFREKYLMGDVTELRVPDPPPLSVAYHPHFRVDGNNEDQSGLIWRSFRGKKNNTNTSLAKPLPSTLLVESGYRFELDDFMTYTELFESLRDYMKKLFCVENLWCYRMIQLYESHAVLAAAIWKNASSSVNTPVIPPPPPSSAQSASGVALISSSTPIPTPRGAVVSEGKGEGGGAAVAAQIVLKLKNMAWEIYRYFVADHSMFEVSIFHAHRKRIMIQMAAPHATIFDPIKHSVHQSILTIFQKFILTEEYLTLSHTLRERLLTTLQNKSSQSLINQRNWVHRYFSCFFSEEKRGEGGGSSMFKNRIFQRKLFPEENSLPVSEQQKNGSPLLQSSGHS
jgi:hypothetical protein